MALIFWHCPLTSAVWPLCSTGFQFLPLSSLLKVKIEVELELELELELYQGQSRTRAHFSPLGLSSLSFRRIDLDHLIQTPSDRSVPPWRQARFRLSLEGRLSEASRPLPLRHSSRCQSLFEGSLSAFVEHLEFLLLQFGQSQQVHQRLAVKLEYLVVWLRAAVLTQNARVQSVLLPC